MSTKTHNSSGYGKDGEPFHDSVTFEPRDINVATVVKQLIYLAITIVISLLICIPVLKVLTSAASEDDTPMAPVRSEMNAAERERMSLPPEPRLQGVPGHTSDAQQDLRDKNAADTEVNESTGWIDKSNGIAKIPVSEAMKIIAEQSSARPSGAPAQEKKKQ